MEARFMLPEVVTPNPIAPEHGSDVGEVPSGGTSSRSHFNPP